MYFKFPEIKGCVLFNRIEKLNTVPVAKIHEQLKEKYSPIAQVCLFVDILILCNL